MDGQVLDERWCPPFIRGWDARNPAPQLHGMLGVGAAVLGQCACLFSPTRPTRELMAVWIHCIEVFSSMQLFGKFRCALPFLPSQRKVLGWMETSCRLDLTRVPDSLRPSGACSPQSPFLSHWFGGCKGLMESYWTQVLSPVQLAREFLHRGRNLKVRPPPPFFFSSPDCLITVDPCHN